MSRIERMHRRMAEPGDMTDAERVGLRLLGIEFVTRQHLAKYRWDERQRAKLERAWRQNVRAQGNAAVKRAGEPRHG